MREKISNCWLGVMCMVCMFMIGMLFPVKVHAEIASGTSGTCSWVIDDDGVLTIRPTDGAEGTLASYTDGNGPWYSYRSQIKKVLVEPGVKAGARCYRLFYNLTACTEMDLSNLDTSSTTEMRQMFYYCHGLTNLDLSAWNTQNVNDFYQIFYGCISLGTLNLSGWDMDSTEGNQMFEGCPATMHLDLSRWKNLPESRTSFVQMLQIPALATVDLSYWDLHGVRRMDYWFSTMTQTLVGLDTWDTKNVTSFYHMFAKPRSLRHWI